MVSAVNFLTGIILARGLSPAEFGRFSLVWLAVFLAQRIQLAAINHIGDAPPRTRPQDPW